MSKLSNDEIALYDRQIRLWGMETQVRLRSSKVLLINLSSVGCEIIKNLVLGGLQSVEILDDSTVKEEDFVGQFFLPNDDSIIGKLKLPLVVDQIKQLNQRVELTINTDSFETQNESYYKNFDLIIGTELSRNDMLKLGDITRQLNIPLYLCGVHGQDGYIITDFIKHTSVYQTDMKQFPGKAGDFHHDNPCKIYTKIEPNKEGNLKLTIEDSYRPVRDIFKSPHLYKSRRQILRRVKGSLPIILALLDMERPEPEEIIDKKLLRDLSLKQCRHLNLPEKLITNELIDAYSRQAFAEFSPTSAVIGGILGQDVIQLLGKSHSPINNFVIFSGEDLAMPVFQI